jgi:hypothetical protein
MKMSVAVPAVLFAMCFFAVHVEAQIPPSPCGPKPYIACSATLRCTSEDIWVIATAEPAGTPCSTTYNGPITGACVVSQHGVVVNASCTGPLPAFTIGGKVSGLNVGTVVTLELSGSGSGPGGINFSGLSSSNGSFVFTPKVGSGFAYSVTVTAPTGQTCAVMNGTGKVNGGNVSNVWVSCQPTGNWTPLANKAPGGVDTMLLLSDGSVLASVYQSTTWFRLIPASDGHYVNGTWTSVPNSNCPHGDFASQVLIDGRVFVAGGETPNPGTGLPGCSGPGQANTGVDTEVYDPVANQWTKADPPTALIDPTQKTTFSSLCGTQAFADMISESLPNGSVLMAPVCPKNCGDTLIFNPATFNPNSLGSGWSFGGTLANTVNTPASAQFTCNQQEVTWVKLQDGSILTADPPMSAGANETSERYIPSLNQWIPDTPLGFTLFDSEFGYSGDGEEGPAFLLPNGHAIFIGGDPATGTYTPGTQAPDSPPVTGTWTKGGLSPNGPATGGAPLSADDVPGAMMVDGNILLALNFAATSADSNGNPTPIFFYEYDFTQGSFIEVLGPGNPGAPSPWTDCSATSMLDLPDGTILMPSGCDGTQLYVYQPGGPPLPQGKPSIISIAPNSDGSYLLTGTGLNGISEGASFGDDAQMASNYPLVRLTDGTGKVTYARTHNWSGAGVMTGSATVSTEFTLPASVVQAPWQTYSLQVVANGNPSTPTSFAAGTRVCAPGCSASAKCGASNGCGGSCPGSCPAHTHESCQYRANNGYLCLAPAGGP